MLSLLIGFAGYKLFDLQKEKITLPVSSPLLNTHDKIWPDVQYLSDSGIRPLTEEELSACRKAIKIGGEELEQAAQSNYGNRDGLDIIGRQIPNKPEIIVIHETVIPASETIKLFQTPHPKDEDQSSYHILVDKIGNLIRIVPDENRAYGSGFSKFGDFTVHSKSPENFSINNVALHISLETPVDGRGDVQSHSGYKDKQYSSLAKQILLWQARYGIPVFRITTHASVDRSHSRYDPRSFRWDEFDYYHRLYARNCNLTILNQPT
ncbi:N-acetylmuramoyl-L-alanine amidase [Cyanobium sp. HWJ4-Hawea]|nr:N-acetylmuramoyl-L-alanine amidase [Cyanobium sp. HWJ4-Hawea]